MIIEENSIKKKNTFVIVKLKRKYCLFFILSLYNHIYQYKFDYMIKKNKLFKNIFKISTFVLFLKYTTSYLNHLLFKTYEVKAKTNKSKQLHSVKFVRVVRR